MADKFERVTLNPTIKVRGEAGMVPVRDPELHETFLSFYDDSGSIGFEQWWKEEGSELFNEWYEENEDDIFS